MMKEEREKKETAAVDRVLGLLFVWFDHAFSKYSWLAWIDNRMEGQRTDEREKI